MGVGGAADNKENAHSQGEQDCPYPVLNANTASGEAGGEGESEEEGKNGDGLDEEDGGEAEGGGLQEVADNAHSGPGPPFSGGEGGFDAAQSLFCLLYTSPSPRD